MEKLVYNISEVADILGISKTFAYTLVKQNKLPAIRIGKRIIVARIRLEQWISDKDKEIDSK